MGAYQAACSMDEHTDASLDALINTTAEIGELLPEFQDMAIMFDQNQQLKDVLVLFFQDILDFYLVALKFFSLSRKFLR